MDEVEMVRQRVREAPISAPPAPWTPMGVVAVGGITEIGFPEDEDLLLVISGHGREIIDCTAGKAVARDSAVDRRSSWYGSHDLSARGFGPLHGKIIPLAGTSGGGLPAFSHDGWGAIRAAVDWPIESLLLTAPFTSIFQTSAEFWKLATAREPVATGFSYSGNVLVVATVDAVQIYARGG